jgi:hypothetical protein
VGPTCRVPHCLRQVEAEVITAGKREAEAALAEAIPALLDAEAALNSIKRDDITEIRSFAKPHVLVQQARRTCSGFLKWRGTACALVRQ